MIKKFMIALIIFFWAGECCGITVGPSRFEVSLPPGEIAVADYYAQNETEEPIHVVVEPENWYKDAYAYKDLAIEDWLELDCYEFDLQPNEIKRLNLTIRVPADVTGELVAQIFFTSEVKGSKVATGGIRARLGAILYVAVKGTEIIEAEIRNINISKITEEGKEKLKIEVNVKNKGNVHLRPTGQVLIEDKKGGKLAELDLRSGRSVLPNKEHIYYATWDEPKLDKGQYEISAKINYGKIFDVEKTASMKRSLVINKKGEVTLK